MGGSIYPALDLRPAPSPLEEFGQAASIYGAMQQQKTAGLQQQALSQENQQRQIQLDDMQKLSQAYHDSGGDLDQMPKLAAQYGVSAHGIVQLNSEILSMREEHAKLDETSLKNMSSLADQVRGSGKTIQDADPNDKPNLYKLAKVNGLSNPQTASFWQHMPDEYPGDQNFNSEMNIMATHSQLAEEGLKEAQTRAADWKEVPGTGTLLNLKTGEQKTAGATMPLPSDLAQTAGIPEMAGKPFSPQYIKTMRDAVDAGNAFQNAGGHLWLVNKQGEKLKDMGISTPIAVFNANNGGFGGGGGGGGSTTPEAPSATPMMDKLGPAQKLQATAVAGGKLDMATITSRMPPSVKANFQAAVMEANPNYNQAGFDIAKKVQEKATSGAWSDQRLAFNTGSAHADLLLQATNALDNGDSRTLNSIKNTFKTAFGSPDVTNWKTIADAYTREVNSALSKGHITDSELATIGGSLPSNASPAQIRGALNSYKNLMASKNQQLDKIIQQGSENGPKATHRWNPQTQQIEAITNP